MASSSLKFSSCPVCHGYGYELSGLGKHLNCTHCHAEDALFAELEGRVLIWKRPINKLTILQNKLQTGIKNIINFSLFLFGIFGLGAGLFSVYQVLMKHEAILSLFDHSGHQWLIYFWLSIILDGYLFYRMEMELAVHKKISHRALGKKIKISTAERTWEEEKKQPSKLDISAFYSLEALSVLEEAYKTAAKLKHNEILPTHLLVALMYNSQISLILGRLGLDYKKITERVVAILKRENRELTGEPDIDLGLNVKKVLFTAYFEACEHRREKVGVTELFLAIVQIDKDVEDIFYDLDVDLRKLHNVVEWIYLRKKLQLYWMHFRKHAGWKPKNHMNRALTARPTPLLDQLAQDFTLKARSGAFFPLVGREKEVSEAFRVLKEGFGNVILVGDSGAGKSTILQGIAEMMTAEDVPKELQDKRLLVLDPGSLIAGAEGLGTLEKRMEQLVFEIAKAGNVILAIEDIHNLLGAGSTDSAIDVGSVLMNYLSQGYLHVIGTTTTPEYQKIIAIKETFLRRFQIVKIPEMNHDEAIQVLEARSAAVEYKQKVYFSYDALEACVTLTDRYIRDRHLPAKALDLMEEVAIYAHEQRGEKAIVSKDDVAQVLTEKTNVPVVQVGGSEAQKLLHLEEIMHKRLVGQDAAITAVAKALRRSREELRDTTRPIANFLFLGPTGVGKTETAKTVAEVYFGSEKNMLRLDMSEYQDKASIRKLIGSTNERGIFTEALKLQPFCLVLLDELEKAHPDILNVFLQVMDDGRITDGTGKTIDCTNTILIATSNAGTQMIQDGMQNGLNSEQIKTRLLEGGLKEYFRPEFLNRFDAVVVFTPLTQEEIAQVAQLLLNKLAQQLLIKGITLEATEAAVLELAAQGYDPLYGARPLRRYIQDTVDDALAKLLLENKITRRDKVILEPGGQMRVIKAEQYT